MKKFSPLEIIVLVLTITVVLSLGATAVNSIVTGTILDEEKAKVVNNIYISVIAIITLYVGSQVTNKNNKDEK